MCANQPVSSPVSHLDLLITLRGKWRQHSRCVVENLATHWCCMIIMFFLNVDIVVKSSWSDAPATYLFSVWFSTISPAEYHICKNCHTAARNIFVDSEHFIRAYSLRFPILRRIVLLSSHRIRSVFSDGDHAWWPLRCACFAPSFRVLTRSLSYVAEHFLYFRCKAYCEVA